MDFDPFEEIGSSERRPPDKEKAMQAAEEAMKEQAFPEALARAAFLEYAKRHFTPEQLDIEKRVAEAERNIEDEILNIKKLEIETAEPTETKKRIGALCTAAAQGIQVIADVTRDTMSGETIETAGQAYNETFKIANSDGFRRLVRRIAILNTLLLANTDQLNAILNASNEIKELAPYLQAELEARAAKNPAFKDMSFNDLLEEITTAGDFTTTIAEEILKAARTRKEKAENAPQVRGTTPNKLDYPVDKLNANIWGQLDEAAKDTSGNFYIAAEKTGSKKEATILYSINFDELETLENVKITKQLTAFDKRVYIAVSNLFKDRKIMSAGQICAAMGYTGTPHKADIQKINDSLTKMGAARICIDNTHEIQISKGYSQFKYDAALLPFERVTAYINNNLCESAIHVFREPPLMSFAQGRKQVTTITRQLLESPLSKTDSNLKIEDYLIERIARMKNGSRKTSRKILYNTIFEKCDITERKQKTRSIDKIKTYLTHHVACGYIKTFKANADGVTIEL